MDAMSNRLACSWTRDKLESPYLRLRSLANSRSSTSRVTSCRRCEFECAFRLCRTWHCTATSQTTPANHRELHTQRHVTTAAIGQVVAALTLLRSPASTRFYLFNYLKSLTENNWTKHILTLLTDTALKNSISLLFMTGLLVSMLLGLTNIDIGVLLL